MTPFGAVIARPALAIHVRSIGEYIYIHPDAYAEACPQTFGQFPSFKEENTTQSFFGNAAAHLAFAAT